MNPEQIKAYSQILQNYFIQWGMEEQWAIFLNALLNLFIVFGVVLLFNFVFRKIFIQAFLIISKKTKTTFDDHLANSNFPKFVSRWISWWILWLIFPLILTDFPVFLKALQLILQVGLVILYVLIFRSILRSFQKYLEEKERFGDKPLESYSQVLMIFAWGIGLFFIIQLLTGYSIKSLATLGAASAVVLLIFKDTILGFVASIQISVNDIVRIGDWITVNKYGADGFVIQINLATVRVQNWDKTFTTIPTYALISDSFQNWRGMFESGGRRIKRSIYIKQSSIRFLSEEDLQRLSKIERVRDYINHRQRDIDRFNKSKEIDKELLLNGRNQTNFGVFRNYVNTYLNENSAINKEYSLMVRHLPPTDKGLPLEIYCFSRDTRWVNFEHIQADIFDHILAALPYFDLEIFESPTGKDVQSLGSYKEENNPD